MIYIGEFREAFGEEYPPLSECVSDTPIPEKNRMLAYLRRSRVAAVSSVRLTDFFTGESIPGEACYYTDGKHAWRSDLCYYFEKYNFILPQAFINAALAR